MENRWSNWLILVLVFLAHGAALGGALLWPDNPPKEVVIPPTISGAIVMAPAEVVQAPSSRKVEPKPKPKPKPKPEPKPEPPPKPKPKPKPEPKVTPPPPPPEPEPEPIPFEEVEEPVQEVVEEQPPPPAPSIDSADPNESKGATVTPPRQDAQHNHNPAPPYPSASRRRGEEGTVILELLILADGSVAEVEVKESSGFPRLDRSAIKAVKRWRYTPATRGDEAIEYRYLQPVKFSLKG